MGTLSSMMRFRRMKSRCERKGRRSESDDAVVYDCGRAVRLIAHPKAQKLGSCNPHSHTPHIHQLCVAVSASFQSAAMAASSRQTAEPRRTWPLSGSAPFLYTAVDGWLLEGCQHESELAWTGMDRSRQASGSSRRSHNSPLNTARINAHHPSQGSLRSRPLPSVFISSS